MTQTSSILPAANFHLWEACNMRCNFCFATFEDARSYLRKNPMVNQEGQLAVVRQLAEAGVDKITFVGGEPTLCPWLGNLVREAKRLGMTTMMVTNGLKLDERALRLSAGIDWIGLSIDSIRRETNLRSGRCGSGRIGLDARDYENRIHMIRDAGIRFKMNTVVSAYNCHENLSDFVAKTKPERWKLFQALRVEGQNDRNPDQWLITDRRFQAFVDRHRVRLPHIPIVPENNDAMTGSYLMIDPAGRVFDNTQGRHTYSQPIHQIGLSAAMSQVQTEMEKFIARGGFYDWSPAEFRIAGTRQALTQMVLSDKHSAVRNEYRRATASA